MGVASSEWLSVCVCEYPSIRASALGGFCVNGCHDFLLGAVFAQLLLVIARSRLQAFHRILPVAGVVSGMLLVVLTLFSAYQLDEATLNSVTQHVLASLAMLIIAIVVWCWHIFTHKAPNKAQLAAALLLALASMTSLQEYVSTWRVSCWVILSPYNFTNELGI